MRKTAHEDSIEAYKFEVQIVKVSKQIKSRTARTMRSITRTDEPEPVYGSQAVEEERERLQKRAGTDELINDEKEIR